MPQADFAYSSLADGGGERPVSLSIYADRARVRSEWRDDLEGTRTDHGNMACKRASVSTRFERSCMP